MDASTIVWHVFLCFLLALALFVAVLIAMKIGLSILELLKPLIPSKVREWAKMGGRRAAITGEDRSTGDVETQVANS